MPLFWFLRCASAIGPSLDAPDSACRRQNGLLAQHTWQTAGWHRIAEDAGDPVLPFRVILAVSPRLGRSYRAGYKHWPAGFQQACGIVPHKSTDFDPGGATLKVGTIGSCGGALDTSQAVSPCHFPLTVPAIANSVLSSLPHPGERPACFHYYEGRDRVGHSAIGSHFWRCLKTCFWGADTGPWVS
jgi:hypothetical protein